MQQASQVSRQASKEYTKTTHLEHVLLRPDTYVGAVNPIRETHWVCTSLTPQPAVSEQVVSYSSGLYKLFDEILVNATDNSQRGQGMSYIKVQAKHDDDDGTFFISVENDGRPIPVVVHDEHNVYIPEMIFGHMLSSSNYDDSVQKTTGGRNGLGAKLANIYSSKFEIDLSDGLQRYRQTFTNNMKTIHPPKIEKAKSKKTWTRVTFWPELERFSNPSDEERKFRPPPSVDDDDDDDDVIFDLQTLLGKMEKDKDDVAVAKHTAILNDSFLALLRRRTLDSAAITGLKVFFNDEQIPVHNFRDYARLFFDRGEKVPQTDAGGDGEDDDDDDDADADADADDDDAMQDGGRGSGCKTAGDDTNTEKAARRTRKKRISKFDLPFLHVKISPMWEFCVGLSQKAAAPPSSSSAANTRKTARTQPAKFQQMSFVNGIWTSKGGTHVRAVTKAIVEAIEGKFPGIGANVSSRLHLQQHLFVLVNCKVENPSFDTQTKVTLTTHVRLPAFNTANLARDFAKHGMYTTLQALMSVHNNKLLTKTDGSKRLHIDVPKLDDANLAGGKHSRQCTLILTEGDSAKALAIAGLGIVGRDHYGVFPLRGKFLNSRNLTVEETNENEEIKNLKLILGLSHALTYESEKDLNSLRYGHVMLMTDQDHDGSHIKGLIINFFHHSWPALLRHRGFLLEFVTPIIKATTARGQSLEFYTLPEYQHWRDQEAQARRLHFWNIKYYKGLGTSTPEEARAYFRNLQRHKLSFVYHNTQDDEAIEIAFDKDKKKAAADRRKQWLLDTYKPDLYFDHATPDRTISFSDFVNKELVLFSMSDNFRSIPSVVDGLKPGQRKILHACFKRKLEKEIKVAQLGGYVAEHTAYHHGEQSLTATIVNMAQNFVGSNNVPLLSPNGQFGTRLNGGKDAASARYIFTQLSPLTRYLFPAGDDPILDYLQEDAETIEPRWFVPILPTALLNSSAGIGTGWSSDMYPFHPRDIVDNIRRWRAGESHQEMIPWFRGFKGTVSYKESGKKGSFVTRGCIERIASDTVLITELPIGVWTEKYKKILRASCPGASDTGGSSGGAGTTGSKKTGRKAKYKERNSKKLGIPILGFTETCDDLNISFRVRLAPQILDDILEIKKEADHEASVVNINIDDDDSPLLPPSCTTCCSTQDKLIQAFQLSSAFSTSNMMFFTPTSSIKHYTSPGEIIAEHGRIRLEYYTKRKVWLCCMYACVSN